MNPTFNSKFYEFMDESVCEEFVLKDKNVKFETFLHYSDPTANRERTVFGKAKEGLFYNYSDRLIGKKWNEGIEKAEKQAKPSTAKFFEIALNHFHDTTTVDLQHIVLGCNMSNGYCYLIFGYTYKEM